MIRKIFQLSHFGLNSRIQHLTAVRNYAPRRRTISKEESEPGIELRKRYFKEDILESHEDPENIDSLEPNFMNLGETHRQHEKEVRREKDKIQRMIVGKKYFKEKSPNFLTYNEKEQIRALHQEDPDKWTVDKLSESFPADPYIISVVIRSKWIPKDTNRIFKHDESVKRNWKSFKEGKLDVEPVLTEHLKKFASRDINKLAERAVNKKLGVEFPRPKSNEFSSIISSCSKYAPKDDFKQIESSELRMPKKRPKVDDNSFIMDGKSKHTSEEMTLSELQQKDSEIDFRVKQFSEMSSNVSEASNLRHSSMKEHNFIALSKNDEKVRESLRIQEKITIPKAQWSKGKIYKVDDCFYADDGEFLYRVPGFK